MKRLLISIVAVAQGVVACLPTNAAVAQAQPASSIVQSLDGEWLLATDPKNEGRDQQWFRAPRPEAVPAKVPWIIQEAFPGYHGVAWYWRDFVPPANPHPRGRSLLRFWGVDFSAEVWLNGIPVGRHESGETPFVLDVTDSLKGDATNRLAVRVLNPTHQPIDGLVLNQTPRQARVIPYRAGAAYNCGGITESVELLLAPAVRVEDLYAAPDPKTGLIRIEVNMHNATAETARGRLEFTVAPASSGETLQVVAIERELAPGDSQIKTEMKIDRPHLWNLNDPFLYRVTARVAVGAAASMDERSVRCGFRDFRFENGYFRLNGRRIFLRSSHTCNHFPIGQRLPHDPDLARRDLLDVKVMGFNAIRFIWGGAERYQLDLCDEVGLMVYEESFASMAMEDSPKMAALFDRSVGDLIRRDRNHPSIVIWGLLNEAENNPAFRHASQMLPLVRSLDDTRMVLLNSGRWDGQLAIGSICNPGSMTWEHLLGDERPGASPTKMTSPGGYIDRVGDAHAYPRVPHTAQTIQFLRTLGQGTKPIFLSEYGIGSAVDLWRVTRHFERLGKAEAEDAQFYRDKLNRYLADWQRWKLDELYARPEDFFAESLRKMAGQRTLGLNAIRSNPNVIGYNLTGMNDHVSGGEGLTTTFRELKPGTVDAMCEGFAPLRWCLFAEPVNVNRGAKVRLEAILADEDALPPGDYPAIVQVIGPDNLRVFERKVTVSTPAHKDGAEPPLAFSVFTAEMPINGPAGKYRLLATLERGGAPTGGEIEFYVDDPGRMPPVEAEAVFWGEDPPVSKWLAEHQIKTRPFTTGQFNTREVILVGSRPPANAAPAFVALAQHMARGSTAIFLSPEVFKKGDNNVGWLPLEKKGSLTPIRGWLYLKDEWAKRHAIFDGLPSGGLMDYTFYREIIPDAVWMGQEPPAEAVAGAINASLDYSSGLMMSVYPVGAGRFILNTLLIRENLGSHPAAERLLRNLLRYAAHDQDQPVADLPADFEAQLKSIGYK